MPRLLLAFALAAGLAAFAPGVCAQPLPSTVEWELVGPSVPTGVDSLANTFGVAFVHDTLVASTSRAGMLRYDAAAGAWRAFRVQRFPTITGRLAPAALTASEAAGEGGEPGAEALFLHGSVDRAGPGETGWTRVLDGSSDPVPVRAFGDAAGGDDPGALYTGTNVFGNGSRTVVRSTDGGRTWAPLSGYRGVYSYGLAYAARVPDPPAGGLPYGALVSADAFGLVYTHGAPDAAADPDTAQALAWADAELPPLAGLNIAAVQAGPRDGGRAGRFLAAMYDGGANRSRVYASDDGGRTWRAVFEHPLDGGGTRVMTAPDGAAYAYYDYISQNGGNTLYGSADGGETWADLGPVGREWPMGIEQLVVGPDGRLYAGGGDGIPGGGPGTGEPAGGVFRTVLPVVAVRSEAPPGAAPGFSVGRPYPNPSSTGALTLPVSLPEAGRMAVAVYDVLGRRLLAEVERYEAGQHAVSLEVAALAPGAYVVRVVTETGAVRTARFVVTR